MKIPSLAQLRSGRLLPMLYKVSEIASELNMNERTLRDWLSNGAPHQRDERNHIWISGSEFSSWITSQRKSKKSGRRLGDHEAYCMHCNVPVTLNNRKVVQVRAKLIRIAGNCPNCGVKINRGGRSD